MARRLVVFSFLAALVFFPLPSWSQTRPTSPGPGVRTLYIRGILRNNDTSEPMQNVKIELKRLTGESVGVTFTRSSGEFEFIGLGGGTYYLMIEERGFDQVRESVELLNSSRWGIQLFLRRSIEVVRGAPGSTVSTRELSIPHKAHDAMEKGLSRFYEKNDFKGSIPFFQRAVAEFPTYYEAYHQMGAAYLHLEQVAEAEQALRKSIELSGKTYFPAHVDLAAMLCNSQRFAEAETVARRSIELDGNSWQGHYQLTCALVGLNQLEAAEKSGQEVRTRKPDYAPLYLLMSNIHIRLRAYPALLEDLDTFLRLEPDGPMSAQARDMREKIQASLVKAQNAPAAPPPKP